MGRRRYALCLYGLVGGTGGKRGKGNCVDFEECFKTINKNIIDVNKTDVFFHTWSVDHEIKLVDLYCPKKYIAEPQKTFNYNLSDFPEFDGPDKFSNSTWGTLANTSRWYSTMKSIELKTLYEQENKFTYDWVMICRFDLLFFVPIKFGNLEIGYFYASNYNHENAEKINLSPSKGRYEDLWFIGSSEFMNKYGQMFHYHQSYKRTPHSAIWNYIQSFENPHKITRYILWRTYDYELYRYHIEKNPAWQVFKEDETICLPKK